MKTMLLVLQFVILSYLGYSQINSFVVESAKDYDNFKISNLYIEGINNVEEAEFLQYEIVSNKLVKRFTFTEKKTNLNRCNIVTDLSLSNEEIKIIINDILARYNALESNTNEMPKFIDTGNPQLDNQTYKEKKIEWIKNNPENYKKLTEPDKKSESNPDRIKKESQTR